MTNPNCIGYIDESLVDDRLKIVFRPTSISQSYLASEIQYLSRTNIITNKNSTRNDEFASW